LYSGFSGRLSDITRTGAVRIIDEPHEAGLIPPDDRFPLDETGVDEESIIVKIVEPETGFIFELVRDMNYLVDTIGNQTFITIFSVSGVSPLITGDGPFQFLVNYILPDQDTVFKVTSYAYSIRIEMFERLLVPYYTLNRTKQDEIFGAIPGGPEDSTIQTVGLSIHKRPVMLSGEYQTVDSRFNPQTRWNIRAEYWELLNHSTSINIKALYQQTDFKEGEGEFSSFNVYREDFFSLTTRANFVFPKRNVTFYASNTISYRDARTRSYAVGFGSGLNWKVGLLNLNTGLNISYRVSELPDGDLESQHRFFYLRAVRELF
jgi:hypothetical protein